MDRADDPARDGDPAAAVAPDTPDLAVLMPTWLGDVVMATPALARLRAALPDTRLTAITPPGLDVILHGLSSVDAVRGVHGKGAAGPWRTAAALRAASRHATVLLPNSFRSALAARLAGVRVRVGTDRDARGPLLTHRVPMPPRRPLRPIPTVAAYDRIVAAAVGGELVDLDGPDAVRLRPRIVAEATDHAAAAAAMGPDEAAAPWLVLVPGGNRADKRWPPGRFVELARSLRARHGLLPVVTGSPGERTLCAELVAALGPPAIDLADRGTNLAVLKAVIAGARLVVTNDTGPRHLAAGLGVPCVALFGPTDPRWTTLPGVREIILLGEPFLPEELVADRHAALCRIDRIPVSDVRHAADRLLALDEGDASSGDAA